MITEDTIQAAYKSMTSALMASEDSLELLERAITARRRLRAGAALGAAALAVVGAARNSRRGHESGSRFNA